MGDSTHGAVTVNWSTVQAWNGFLGMSSRTSGSNGSTCLRCLELSCLTNISLEFVSPNLRLTRFEVSAPHVHVVSIVMTYVQIFCYYKCSMTNFVSEIILNDSRKEKKKIILKASLKELFKLLGWTSSVLHPESFVMCNFQWYLLFYLQTKNK
jgi:hypothetical protein